MKRTALIAALAALTLNAYAMDERERAGLELKAQITRADAYTPGVERCKAEPLPSCAALLDAAIPEAEKVFTMSDDYCARFGPASQCAGRKVANDVERESLKALRERVRKATGN